MVKIHVKRGDESQFICETSVAISVDQLIIMLVGIFNGKLKVERISQGTSISSCQD